MPQARQSSVVLRVFALILACVVSSAAAMAQEKGENAQPKTVDNLTSPAATAVQQTSTAALPPKPTAETAANASTTPAKSNNSTPAGSTNAANDYKQTLGDLEALYLRQVQRVETENAQLKALYNSGLVARVDVEKSDKDLADARAELEESRNQIAEANKPKPTVTGPQNPVASNVAWSTGNATVDNLVRFYGNKYGVDPYLIYCLMHQESRFTNSAISPKGAQGLMQLMPGTAARYGVTNPYDVAQSISGGTHYLKDLLQMFNGRIDLALAGYNAGENAVIKHGYKVPPYEETRNYVRLITARYAMKPAT